MYSPTRTPNQSEPEVSESPKHRRIEQRAGDEDQQSSRGHRTALMREWTDMAPWGRPSVGMVFP
ncbi:hypothetical protein [Arthrobacter sp.]|uniref:hypothetical protein n=1 Tax=Arthrobacter sp. TaxID=1667 RepID=UPI003A8F2340